MKYRISVLVMILFMVIITSCTANKDYPEEVRSVAEYVEEKGYDIVSYEGRGQSYLLTKGLITELPHMMYWGVQPFDASVYLGQRIEVENFIVENHPLSEDRVDVSVFVVENQPIGGTAFPHGDTSDGGYWNLDGKTLEEIQTKPFQEWKADWEALYAE